MNDKQKRDLEVLSRIDSEIIDTNSRRRAELMGRIRRRLPKWIIPTAVSTTVAAALLLVTAVPLLILLFGKQVPVYEGMTVLQSYSAASAEDEFGPPVPYRFDRLSTAKGNDNPNSGTDNGNHYGHNKRPVKDVVEDDGSLGIDIPEQDMYYAQKNQDIYINIHISNPDSFEILSFTLNGKKYSSYMFEEGSDMENLILKVNVGDVEGVIDYTIDAIKYVDGTEIKDVVMRGERTVKVGVATSKQPTAAVHGEVIGLSSVEFDVTLTDPISLIGGSEGRVYAVLCNDGGVLAQKELPIGESHVVFDGLETNTAYRYGVVAYYDALDGQGFASHSLCDRPFVTPGIVSLSDVEIDRSGFRFGVVFSELFESQSLVSMTLYHGNEKVKDFDVGGDVTATVFSADGLLSGNKYRIVMTYERDGKTENVEYTLTTEAMAEPVFEIGELTSTLDTVSGAYDQTDTDGTLIAYKVGLYSNNALIEESADRSISFAGLDPYTDYTACITYTFDLSDGKGVQEKSVRRTVRTLPYLDAESLTVLNTDVVYDGETVYLQIALDNPHSATVRSITVNGMTYVAGAASTADTLLVEIKNKGQFPSGDVTLTLEELTFTLDGNDYTAVSETRCSDVAQTVTRMQIASIECVDANLEPSTWIPMTPTEENRRYLLITLEGPQIGEIKQLSVRIVANDVFNEFDFTPAQIQEVDGRRFLIAIPDLSEDMLRDPYGVSTVEFLCGNDYVEDYTVSADASSSFHIIDRFITVSTVEELIDLGSSVKPVYVDLTADLDFSEVRRFTGIWHFNGVFDGNGHTVKNLSMLGVDDGVVGLFRNVSGEIRNLTLDDSKLIVDDNAVGGIVGRMVNGIIQNCKVGAGVTISATHASEASEGVRAGGILGIAEGNVRMVGCESHATVSGTTQVHDAGNAHVGGIVGYAGGDANVVSNCQNYGSVSASGVTSMVNVGGIAGYGEDTLLVERCANHGDVECSLIGEPVSGISFGSAGGIAGSSTAVQDCINYGTVVGCGSTGGIIGHAGNTFVDRCLNAGSVSTVYTCSGGIAGGQWNSVLSGCINAGAVRSQANSHDGEASRGICYDYGSVPSGDYPCYSAVAVHAGDPLCTTAQLNSKDFYTKTLGWSEEVWDLSELDFANGTYPKLK